MRLKYKVEAAIKSPPKLDLRSRNLNSNGNLKIFASMDCYSNTVSDIRVPSSSIRKELNLKNKSNFSKESIYSNFTGISKKIKNQSNSKDIKQINLFKTNCISYRTDILKNYNIDEKENEKKLIAKKVKLNLTVKTMIPDLNKERNERFLISKMILKKYKEKENKEKELKVENEDKAYSENLETTRLKTEIRKFLKENIKNINYIGKSINNQEFYAKKENLINFRQDILISPNIKNKIHHPDKSQPVEDDIPSSTSNNKLTINCKNNSRVLSPELISNSEKERMENLQHSNSINLKINYLLCDLKIKSQIEQDKLKEHHKLSKLKEKLLNINSNNNNSYLDLQTIESNLILNENINQNDFLDYLTTKNDLFKKVDFAEGRARDVLNEIIKVNEKGEKKYSLIKNKDKNIGVYV